MPIELRYPDGKVVEHADGATAFEVAESIGPRLAKAAVGAKLNGELVDISRPLHDSGDFSVVTLDTPDGLDVLRHSSAHVLAQAVLGLFEGSTFAIGPAIEDGFYYDFKVDRPFTPEDLERIEQRMSEIIAADQPFEREAVSREEALQIFADHPFKREIIEAVDPDEGAAGGAGHPLSESGIRRSVPGPPSSLHRPDPGLQAAEELGCLLAWRREP